MVSLRQVKINLATNIKRLKNEKKLTNDYLMKNIPCSESTIYGIQNIDNKHFPTLQLLIKIAETLHTTLDELIKENPYESPHE